MWPYLERRSFLRAPREDEIFRVIPGPGGLCAGGEPHVRRRRSSIPQGTQRIARKPLETGGRGWGEWSRFSLTAVAGSEGTNPTDTSVLGFWPPDLWENKRLLFPWCFVTPPKELLWCLLSVTWVQEGRKAWDRTALPLIGIRAPSMFVADVMVNTCHFLFVCFWVFLWLYFLLLISKLEEFSSWYRSQKTHVTL